MNNISFLNIAGILTLIFLASPLVAADEIARIPEPNQPLSGLGPSVGRAVRLRAENISVTGSFAFTDAQKRENLREGNMTRDINEWLIEVLEKLGCK
ncbi:hypothetical protein ACFLRF_00940 [Candidatus Altiarchaeota archaeon]